MDKNCLTQRELKFHLSYDSSIGEFIWLNPTGPRVRYGEKAGKRPICKTKQRYSTVVIHGKRYPAHHLAWLYVYGYLPDLEIDHINGDSFDNRISNLRLVDRINNTRNAKRRSDNKSGIAGVSWRQSRRCWIVRIGAGDRDKSMGQFHDFLEACCVRKSLEVKLGYHANHGRL